MDTNKRLTPVLLLSIASAVTGMFQFGYNTGVINAPQEILTNFISDIYQQRNNNQPPSLQYRDILWSITVSIFAVGGMIGALLSPMATSKIGRKTALMCNNFTAIIGALFMASSKYIGSYETLMLGRLFIGIHCGISMALVPMYLSEIAPTGLRGALGTVNQLAVTVGLLSSQILGQSNILGNLKGWPALLGFSILPSLIQLISLPFCPESPRYLLLNKGDPDESCKSLRRLRCTNDVDADVDEMRAEEKAQLDEINKYGKISSVFELLSHSWLRVPLLIGVIMQFSQQFSGINGVFYYSTSIFLSAGLSNMYAVYSTMGVGIIMVLMTIISIPLMDRLGRRTLHLLGLGGMFFMSIALTTSLALNYKLDWIKYVSVVSTLLYTLFFAIGPGSIPLMITAELFTQGTRPAAMSVSVLFNWFANFVVGLAFPLLQRNLQSYVFVPFTLLLAIFWLFTYKKLPETKNRTFEEIAAIFKSTADDEATRVRGYGASDTQTSPI